MKQASLVFLLVAFSCLVVPCGVARADPRNREAAETLFSAGRASLQAGNYAAACEQFHASDELEHARGTWLNLGLCEERLGHWVSACDYYQRVFEGAPAGDARALIARQQVAALEPRVPRVTLRLAPGAPSDTVVSYGSVEYDAAHFAWALPADPGLRRFTVMARGFAVRDYDVSLAEGEHVELTVAPGAPLAPSGSSASGRDSPAAAPATVPPDRRPVAAPTHGSSRALGWTLIAAGGAALAVGATTGVMLLHDQAVVEADCDASKGCGSTRSLDAAAQGRRLNIVSPAMSIAGVLLAGAGAYILVQNPHGSAPTRLGARVSRGAAELEVVHAF